MSRLAVVAFSASAIWPYTLAKKNTGMNTIMTMPRMMFSTPNARLAKMCTLISGDSVRRSMEKKMPSRTTPAPMHSSMAGLPHPHRDDCWKPNTLSPTPQMMRARPR
jgi:hypothetical protein